MEGPRGSSFTAWDPGKYAKKASGYGHVNPWGPFPSEGNLVHGRGLINWDFDE